MGMAARVLVLVLLRFWTKVRLHHTNARDNNGCFFHQKQIEFVKSLLTKPQLYNNMFLVSHLEYYNQNVTKIFTTKFCFMFV